ncbi:MAG: hypothetical protein RLZZ591_1667 [Pseudomonadota bacterium]|jgi:OOP family OmpA-OmpF porin
MKKVQLVAAIVTLAISASNAALAQDSGLFVSVGVGRPSTPISDLPAGWTSDQSDIAFGIKGGYGFSTYFGVEVGYQNFGDISLNKPTGSVTGSSTIHGTGWMVGGYASYPVTSDVEVLARAGWCEWSINQTSQFTSGANTQVDTFKETGNDTYFGLGATWKLSTSMAVGLNWTRFKAPTNTGIFGATNLVDVSLTHRF